MLVLNVGRWCTNLFSPHFQVCLLTSTHFTLLLRRLKDVSASHQSGTQPCWHKEENWKEKSLRAIWVSMSPLLCHSFVWINDFTRHFPLLWTLVGIVLHSTVLCSKNGIEFEILKYYKYATRNSFPAAQRKKEREGETGRVTTTLLFMLTQSDTPSSFLCPQLHTFIQSIKLSFNSLPSSNHVLTHCPPITQDFFLMHFVSLSCSFCAVQYQLSVSVTSYSKPYTSVHSSVLASFEPLAHSHPRKHTVCWVIHMWVCQKWMHARVLVCMHACNTPSDLSLC